MFLQVIKEARQWVDNTFEEARVEAYRTMHDHPSKPVIWIHPDTAEAVEEVPGTIVIRTGWTQRDGSLNPRARRGGSLFLEHIGDQAFVPRGRSNPFFPGRVGPVDGYGVHSSLQFDHPDLIELSPQERLVPLAEAISKREGAQVRIYPGRMYGEIFQRL